MIYLQLFFSFLKVGMFSVGGGYAAIPLIQSQAVEACGWLTMDEFTNLVTIAEMTPGPIAINAATFVGIRIAGIAGAAAATLGCIFPSFLQKKMRENIPHLLFKHYFSASRCTNSSSGVTMAVS